MRRRDRKLYVMVYALAAAYCVLLLCYLQQQHFVINSGAGKPVEKVNNVVAEKVEYPKRTNMSTCVPKFGKIGVFVAIDDASLNTKYAVALRTLECYMKSVNYSLFIVNVDQDESVNQVCKHSLVSPIEQEEIVHARQTELPSTSLKSG